MIDKYLYIYKMAAKEPGSKSRFDVFEKEGKLQECSGALSLCSKGGSIGGTTFADINEIGCWLSFVFPDGVKKTCASFKFGDEEEVGTSVEILSALVEGGEGKLDLEDDDVAAITLLGIHLSKLTNNTTKLAGLVKMLQGYGMACYLGDALPAYPSNLYCTNDRTKLYAAINSTTDRTNINSNQIDGCYANNTSRKTNPADLLLEFASVGGGPGGLLGLSLKAAYKGNCVPTICNLGMSMSDKTIADQLGVATTTLWDVAPIKKQIAVVQRIIDSRMDEKWAELDQGDGTYAKGKKKYTRPPLATPAQAVAAAAMKRDLLIAVTVRIVDGMVQKSETFKWAGGSPSTGTKKDGYLGLLRMILHCQPDNLDYIFMSANGSDFHGIDFAKFKANLVNVDSIKLVASAPSGDLVISTPIHFILRYKAAGGQAAREETFTFIIRAKRMGSFGPTGDSIKVNISIKAETVAMLTKNYPIEAMVEEEGKGGGMKPKVGGMKLRSGFEYGWDTKMAEHQIASAVSVLEKIVDVKCPEEGTPLEQILARERNEMEEAEDEESQITEAQEAAEEASREQQDKKIRAAKRARSEEAKSDKGLQGGRRKMRKRTRRRTRRRKRSFTHKKKTSRRRRKKNRKKTKRRRKKYRRRRTQYK